jgi:DNA-directed RNA polymerase specialized sigma24 family protein
MSDLSDLSILTLAGIAHRCAQETELFFRRQANDPRYCFELFRRAIQERSQRAWDLVYSQYRSLVAGWVLRHPAFAACGEEAEYLANRAFEKMWAALTPDKFGHMPDLKSVLRYLQMCVHSVVVDEARLGEPPAEDLPADDSPAAAGEWGRTAQNVAVDRLDREQFWEAIGRRLLSDKERRVVYGSFVLALKPREICAEFPGTFRDVTEAYRVKQNVLERLGRDAELRELLGLDA